MVLRFPLPNQSSIAGEKTRLFSVCYGVVVVDMLDTEVFRNSRREALQRFGGLRGHRRAFWRWARRRDHYGLCGGLRGPWKDSSFRERERSSRCALREDGAASVASRGLGGLRASLGLWLWRTQRLWRFIFCAPPPLLSRSSAHSMPHSLLYYLRGLSPRRWRGLISLWARPLTRGIVRLLASSLFGVCASKGAVDNDLSFLWWES